MNQYLINKYAEFTHQNWYSMNEFNEQTKELSHLLILSMLDANFDVNDDIFIIDDVSYYIYSENLSNILKNEYDFMKFANIHYMYELPQYSVRLSRDFDRDADYFYIDENNVANSIDI